MSEISFLWILVIVSGFYMAWNIGANDVANAMGTSVGSGALRLKQAIIIAAVLEFSGAFFFGSHVSETIQRGIVNPSIFQINPMLLVYGMLAALISVGLWLQCASYFGWPVSTTHAIVGAVVGFGASIGGWHAIYWGKVGVIVSSWLISPILGGILSYLLFSFLRTKIFYSPKPLHAARQLMPYLVFFVLFILCLLLLLDGLPHVQLGLGKALTLSFFLSALFAIGTHFIQKKRTAPQVSENELDTYNPELIYSLEKARKQLKRAQNQAQGQTMESLSPILADLEQVASSLPHPKDRPFIGTAHGEIERLFGSLQILSACLMAFAHGANDVANAIGPLSACISVLSTGVVPEETAIPSWVLALGGLGIVIGLATWGWRVIQTVGKKITELTPTRGFAAEFGAATTILVATRLGLPISTTHTLVGAVIGVGLARGMEALNLATVRHIVASWVVTVPCAGLISVFFFHIFLWTSQI